MKLLHILYKNSLHTYNYLTSWSWDLPQKPPIVQLLKDFPAFYGTRRFITVFTTALHWSPSWARSIQSIQPHPISLRSILILSTHFIFLVVSFLLAFPQISYMHSSSPLSCYIPCPSHPSSLRKLNSVAVVRKQIIPTELPPLVGEVSADLCG
jgi:hypothetical protein